MALTGISDCCFLSIPKDGVRLIWEVTQYCPFSCEYCFTWSSPKREKFESNIALVIPRLMELIKRIGVKDVLITGGEPLAVAHEITPLLGYLRVQQIPFAISTNLYDEAAFLTVCEYQPHTVNLSLDPPVAGNRRSSFKADFEKVESKVRKLKEAGLNVKLTAVICRANHRGVPALLEYLGEFAVRYENLKKIAFNREYPIGFAAESEPQMKSELEQTYGSIANWSNTMPIPVTLVNWSEFHAPLQTCAAAKHVFSVQQNADVTPCSLLYNITRSFRAGNLLRDPIDIIVARLNTFAQDLSKYYDQTEAKTSSCSTCTLRSACGGGCLAMLPIASNHITRRTCEITPHRIKDHERLLLSEFHRKYHEVYSPEPKKFAAPNEALDKTIENRIRKYVREKIEPSDLAHTFEHVDSVVKLAKKISNAEGASLKITIPAAYFHDLAPREAAMHHMHTYKSAALAGRYLGKIDYFTPKEIAHIRHCIITSSYGSYLLGYKPLSLEAKVVRDADWLDAIGARGIARVFTFGQAHGAKDIGHPVYDPEELPITIDMNITGPDDSPIYHFYTKLLKIYELLETETARKLGEERHKFMVGFLRQYRAETGLISNDSHQPPLQLK